MTSLLDCTIVQVQKCSFAIQDVSLKRSQITLNVKIFYDSLLNEKTVLYLQNFTKHYVEKEHSMILT